MNKEKILKLLAWLFLVLAFAGAWMISLFEEYHAGFLAFLVFLIVLAFVVAPKAPPVVLTISRIALGMLFIYSGFVKGVDPLGTQWRITDYFYAFNTLWAIPFALVLSVLLNAFEFSLGAWLLLKLRMRLTGWLLLGLMVFFTLTTWNDAVDNPVPDCGCFGDALIITNWQTFYKNLIIDAFVVLLFYRRTSFVNLRSTTRQWSSMLGVFALFAVFELYTIYHLPVVDFRPWKEGNRLLPEHPQAATYYFTYKNKKTGEEKEYAQAELPWSDSTFKADWQYLSTREDDPNAGMYKTFPMTDESGNDLSKALVSSPTPVFFMVVYDMAEAKPEALKKFDVIYRYATRKGYEFYMLNSDLPEERDSLRRQYGLEQYPVLEADDTALKAAVRSNPGLIIVRDGRVIKKYNWRQIPPVEELDKVALQ